MELIRSRVNAVRNRHQRQWMWQCCSWGLVIGGLVACMLAAWRGISAGSLPSLTIAAVLVVGPALGYLFSILRPRALREAAVCIDRSCGLKDRVTTALGFIGETKGLAPLRALQISDAATHLEKIDPAAVAPIRAPKPWYWGLVLTVAALAIGFFTGPQPQAIANTLTNDVVSSQAMRVGQELDELKQFNEQEGDSEVERLLKELAEKVEELSQPGVDPKEALAKLSEMEAMLEQQQQELANQNVEASLKELGEALTLAEPLQSAGDAMSKGNMEKAAEELAKMELPKLDRKTEKALVEKLEQQAKKNSGGGSQKALREATEKMAQGITHGDRGKFKDGLKGLASECKKQGQRKKLTDLLRKQCQCLCECKGECESECKNDAESNKKGGTKAGLARSGNQPGDKTAKLKSEQEMKLAGQESDSGDSDLETQQAPEQEQQAAREYRANVKKYEQLAESALDAEPIPLGHRQTIRRYFELIRPQNGETDAVLERVPSESK